MFTSNKEKNRNGFSHETTVNRDALHAWLQAWTTGLSFPTVVSGNLKAPTQTAKELLARLRYGRLKNAERL